MLFSFRFCEKVFARKRQVFDYVQRVVYFNQRTKEVDRLPKIAKKRLLMRNYRKHSLNFFEETKSTPNSESFFAAKIEQVKKTQYKLELMEIVDYILDGYGIILVI